MRKLLIILLLLPAILIAQIPDPLPGTYVNDLAHVLTQGDVAKLNEQIYSVEKKYSVQIAVVLINELPTNYGIEDYARDIGRKWHAGNARNGLVYVAAINQRKQRLEVAANLEGTITDATALHLTDNIKPFFRNKDYYGGLANLVKDINTQLDPVTQEQQRLAKEELSKKEQKEIDTFFTVIFWLFGICGVVCIGLYIYFKRKKKKESIKEPNRVKYDSEGSYSRSNYITPIVINNESDYTPPARSYSDYTPPGRSYDSDSYSSSDYGNWGSGSSDSSSSYDSGFSGGGSSNDW